MADLEYLVSFNCTARIHYAVGSRHPVQHSCKFSLALVKGAQPCFVMEGTGIGKPKKIKFSPSSLDTVAASRIGDGRLSVTARNLDWDTVAVSDVQDKRALGQLYQFLDSMFKGTFLKDVGSASGCGQVSTAGRTPPPSVLVNRRSPEDHSSSAKKKRVYNLTTNSNNWRGASMVAAALANSKTTPSEKANSFYGSKSPAGDSLTSPLPSIRERSGIKSAKRVLLLNDGELKPKEEDDFLPSPKYHLPPDSAQKLQRPPLGALSPVPQTSNVARGNGKLESLLRSEADPDGFANLGNTCYMNAVLQSLLGLYPFAEDLQTPSLVKNVHPNSLYRMIVILLKCKRAKDSLENQRILLKKIKAAISTNTQKFIGFRQQDAHELLSQCLDQLKEDVEHVGNHGNEDPDPDNAESASSPVVVNFQSSIDHRIVCKECGHVTRTSQVSYDFSLQLPKRVHYKHNEQANLQQLFDQFFADEEVEFNCTSCQCKSATLSLQLAKLPRILILHLKRYGYNYQLSENSKRVDNIRIPRYINVGHLAKTQCEPPLLFTAPNPRDRHSLTSVLGQGEEKENLPTSGSTAQEPTPLTQTPPLTQRPAASTQETTPKIQVAVLAESNHNAHTTITSYTPPTTPSITKVTNHTTRENAIEILESEEETTSENIGDARLAADTNMVSHDSHMIGRGHSLSPASKYIPGECLASSSGVHRPCVSEAHSSSVNSLLGKRKRYERYPKPERDDSGQCGSHDFADGAPVKSLCSSDSRATTGISPCVTMDTNSRGDESRGATAEIDEMLATVPLEELTDFPIVALDNNASSAAKDAIPNQNVTTCTKPTKESDFIPLSEVKGESTCAEVRGDHLCTGDCDGSMSPVFDQESEDLRRAMQESLRTQEGQSEFQLAGLSEDEQLRLALELSIQDSLPTEAPPSSSPYQETTPVGQIMQTTPTPEKHSQETYRLVSIVNHIGKGSAGGHYISDVYSFPDHSWRTYNDEQVSEVREEDVRQRRQTTGYIFFYLHRATFTSMSAHFGR